MSATEGHVGDWIEERTVEGPPRRGGWRMSSPRTPRPWGSSPIAARLAESMPEVRKRLRPWRSSSSTPSAA